MCIAQRFWRFCHDSACVDQYQELGACLQLFSRFESLVYKCRFQHESRASTSWPVLSICMDWRAFRAGLISSVLRALRVSACVCT
jgi:hypothetical protein